MINIFTSSEVISGTNDYIYGYIIDGINDGRVCVEVLRNGASKQQAEVIALREALKKVSLFSNVVVTTSTGYIIDTMTKWIDNRRKNNWMEKPNKEYKYAQIWREIDSIILNMNQVEFKKADKCLEIREINKRMKEYIGKQPENNISNGRIKVDDNCIVVYCDGWCRGNKRGSTNVGGWGVVLRMGEYSKEMCGFAQNTTNNIMELTAIIQALKAIKKPQIPVVVYTDSRYVCDGITKWMPNWKANGWKKRDGEVINSELWIELDRQLSKFTHYNINWVKGHASNPGNNRADLLANRAMDDLERKIREYRY